MSTAMPEGVAADEADKAGARRPVLTAAVVAVTTITSAVALASPAVMRLFVRNLPRLQGGQWWRVATPVLVQPSGWGQLAFNILGIALVGAALQRRFGCASWAVIYVSGGVGSIAVYSAWHPGDVGGGSSAAVAALIGAFLIGANTDAQFGVGPLQWSAEVYSVFFAVYLTTLDLAGITASIIAGNAAIIAMCAARRVTSARSAARGSLVVILVASVAMILARDDHGVGLGIGVMVAGLVLTRRWLLARPSSQPWRATAIAVPMVVAAAVVTWVVWVPMLGIPLTVRQPGGAESRVGWLSVAVTAVAICLAASFALSVLTRHSSAHGGARWLGLCLAVALLSFIGPVTDAVGIDAMVALLSLHVMCTAAVIALLAPTSHARPASEVRA